MAHRTAKSLPMDGWNEIKNHYDLKYGNKYYSRTSGEEFSIISEQVSGEYKETAYIEGVAVLYRIVLPLGQMEPNW